MLGGNTPDGTLTWVDQGVLDHYVIDPLGAALIGNQLGNGAPCDCAGRSTIDYAIRRRQRRPAALSQAVAAQTVTLPDSWVEQARSAVTPGAAPHDFGHLRGLKCAVAYDGGCGSPVACRVNRWA